MGNNKSPRGVGALKLLTSCEAFNINNIFLNTFFLEENGY